MIKKPKLWKKYDNILYGAAGYTKDYPSALQMKRDLLAGFSTHVVVPESLPTRELEKSSSIKVKIEPHHSRKGFSLWWTNKKHVVIPHPVVMQHQRRRNWW